MDSHSSNRPHEQGDTVYLQLTPLNVMRQLVFRIIEHDVSALGAQMTYYLVLSAFPFLMVPLNIVATTGLVPA